MRRHVVVLTGGSRGLGLAIAQQLLAREGTDLLVLARHPSAALEATATSRLTQWTQDLARPLQAAARVGRWLDARADACDAATLINNAAALTPPGAVDDTETLPLSDAIRVGLEAPVLLTAAFLRATRSWRARRRVLNISSGLGRRAMAGSAPYCAVKAGLDNFSRAVALDEERKPNGARIVSLAPGVIDTDMQVQLRAADADKLPDRDLFVGFKQSGALASPADAATRVLAYLERDDFGSKVLADVRDA